MAVHHKHLMSSHYYRDNNEQDWKCVKHLMLWWSICDELLKTIISFLNASFYTSLLRIPINMADAVLHIGSHITWNAAPLFQWFHLALYWLDTLGARWWKVKTMTALVCWVFLTNLAHSHFDCWRRPQQTD